MSGQVHLYLGRGYSYKMYSYVPFGLAYLCVQEQFSSLCLRIHIVKCMQSEMWSKLNFNLIMETLEMVENLNEIILSNVGVSINLILFKWFFQFLRLRNSILRILLNCDTGSSFQ